MDSSVRRLRKSFPGYRSDSAFRSSRPKNRNSAPRTSAFRDPDFGTSFCNAEVVCNIAGWRNTDQQGSYITVEISRSVHASSKRPSRVYSMKYSVGPMSEIFGSLLFSVPTFRSQYCQQLDRGFCSSLRSKLTD